MNDLVEECFSAVRTIASAVDVEVSLQTGEDVPFRGDEELLRRMIMNLLNNAVSYTPAGGSVRVSLTTRDASVRLTVSDTGVGIPAESHARIFDRFYRVPDQRQQSSVGSGLGLSIVKLAAESHAGSISLSSQLGQGSIFTVDLPLGREVGALV